MAETERDYVESRKVCCGNLEEIRKMDWESMTTPMTTNLKLFGDTTSERVDATLCRQMIGSMPDICFMVNTLS